MEAGVGCIDNQGLSGHTICASVLGEKEEIASMGNGWVEGYAVGLGGATTFLACSPSSQVSLTPFKSLCSTDDVVQSVPPTEAL